MSFIHFTRLLVLSWKVPQNSNSEYSQRPFLWANLIQRPALHALALLAISSCQIQILRSSEWQKEFFNVSKVISNGILFTLFYFQILRVSSERERDSCEKERVAKFLKVIPDVFVVLGWLQKISHTSFQNISNIQWIEYIAINVCTLVHGIVHSFLLSNSQCLKFNFTVSLENERQRILKFSKVISYVVVFWNVTCKLSVWQFVYRTLNGETVRVINCHVLFSRE